MKSLSRPRLLAVGVFVCSALLLTFRLWNGPRPDPERDAAMFRGSVDSSRTVFLRTDFASFYYAAKASAHGLNIYAARVLDSLAAADGVANHVLPYLYPPFFAIVAQPMARLSPQTAQRLWDAVQVLCVSCACVLIMLTLPFRSADVSGGSYWTVGSLITCASVVVFPFGENLAFGQINFLILILITASIFLSINIRRDVLAGMALAAATLIKVTPALLLVPFLVNKRWNVLGGFWGGSALLVLATFDLADKNSWRAFLDFLPNMGYARNVQGGFHPSIVANFSLAGFFMRLLPGEGTAIRLLTMMTAVLLFAVILFHQVKKQTPRNDASFILPYLILMLVASPVTWRHHLILLLPGVVFVLRGIWFEEQGRRRVKRMLAITVLATLSMVDFQALYPLISMPELLRPVLTAMNLWFLILLLAASLRMLPMDATSQVR